MVNKLLASVNPDTPITLSGAILYKFWKPYNIGQNNTMFNTMGHSACSSDIYLGLQLIVVMAANSLPRAFLKVVRSYV